MEDTPPMSPQQALLALYGAVQDLHQDATDVNRARGPASRACTALPDAIQCYLQATANNAAQRRIAKYVMQSIYSVLWTNLQYSGGLAEAALISLVRALRLLLRCCDEKDWYLKRGIVQLSLDNAKMGMLLLDGADRPRSKEEWTFHHGKLVPQLAPPVTTTEFTIPIRQLQHNAHSINNVRRIIRFTRSEEHITDVTFDFMGRPNHVFQGPPLWWLSAVPTGAALLNTAPDVPSLRAGDSRYGCFRFMFAWRDVVEKVPDGKLFILGTREYWRECCHSLLLTSCTTVTDLGREDCPAFVGEPDADSPVVIKQDEKTHENVLHWHGRFGDMWDHLDFAIDTSAAKRRFQEQDASGHVPLGTVQLGPEKSTRTLTFTSSQVQLRFVDHEDYCAVDKHSLRGPSAPECKCSREEGMELFRGNFQAEEIQALYKFGVLNRNDWQQLQQSEEAKDEESSAEDTGTDDEDEHTNVVAAAAVDSIQQPRKRKTPSESSA